MNSKRRRKLNEALDALMKLRGTSDFKECLELLRLALQLVEECIDEEEEALDNRPESMRWSSGNEEMEENISDLSDATGNLEGILADCEDDGKFSYEEAKDDIVETVNLIKQTINR